jgi:two-component system CheB/CheR fusion protein
MAPAPTDRDVDALLEFLKRNRGFDFTGYKRSTLERRVAKRMDAVGIESYAAYLDFLEAEANEFTELFNTLLINVTRFFRDDAPWEYLAAEVLPALIARTPPDLPIRVWSAGCASGEEAYTLAILFAEALGIDGVRDRVKIYATDADDEALAAARAASYTEQQVEGVPEALREKYFDRSDGRSVFRKDLRRSVIFGRNDLVQDAPISRIDLLVCRNTLMYFNAATQAGILGRFHFALVDGGILFLGRAETLLTNTSAFQPLDLKRRIFTKVGRLGVRDRLSRSIQAGDRDNGESSSNHRLRDSAFEAGGESQIVLNRSGQLVLANARARTMFGLGANDIGRPLQDLEISYRPVELRSLVERCYVERASVLGGDVQWRPRNALDDRWLTVEVSPLAEGGGVVVGASVLFSDVTETRRLHHELEDSKQHLETAYEELQSTNEELETTNEELQSTVEELETTNEELQSTNEELETMNEELHSTNEELETINDELRRRGVELVELNDFLAAVFASMKGGVVVLDREMRVLVWNAQSEEMWGVRASEVMGTNFFALDIGFPVDRLATPIRAALAGKTGVDSPAVEARDRRGRALVCQVSVAPLFTPERTVRGAILVMESVAGGS